MKRALTCFVEEAGGWDFGWTYLVTRDAYMVEAQVAVVLAGIAWRRTQQGVNGSR